MYLGPLTAFSVPLRLRPQSAQDQTSFESLKVSYRSFHPPWPRRKIQVVKDFAGLGLQPQLSTGAPDDHVRLWLFVRQQTVAHAAFREQMARLCRVNL